MLDEHRGQRGPRLQYRAELAQELRGGAGGECLLRDAATLGLVQAEPEQRPDHPARTLGVQVDGDDVAGLGVAPDEEDVEDPQGAAALHAFEGTNELALESGPGAESVQQELRHDQSVTDARWPRLTRMR